MAKITIGGKVVFDNDKPEKEIKKEIKKDKPKTKTKKETNKKGAK